MFEAFDRRQFLAAAAGAALAGPLSAAQDRPRRPRVAAVYTVFHYRSHAHVILENFLRPYLFNGRRTDPGVDVVSLYSDQTKADGDMTQDVSRQFKVPVFRTIAEALCVGGKELAVDAVLLIGEHGDYPVNKLGQREYPRKRFFDEAVAVMRRSRRYVPVFNDKHLSYRWDWAREMYDTARNLGIPLMAGSSVPLAQRRPEMELPAGAVIEEAVSIHGGPVESYDFHGLEVLQALVESRKGGERGVSSVEFLRGDAVWNAARARRWSLGLAEAALGAELGRKVTLPRDAPREKDAEPHAILLTYRDGLRAAVLRFGTLHTRWDFACKLAGDDRVRATSFYVGPWGNRNLFKALSHAIQHHFINRRSPYPVERTLLTTGALEAAMRARLNNRPVETPNLNIAYEPRDFRAFREMGASWKIITEKTPQPRGVDPGPDR
jgi:hypothetical protein